MRMSNILYKLQGTPFDGGGVVAEAETLESDGEAAWPCGLPDFAEAASAEPCQQLISGHGLHTGREEERGFTG
jgi:hypothetical protein